VNPGNKEAEEKFKTINEAYQVLSDVKQRKKYDELRAQYQQWQKMGGQQGQDFDWQNWSLNPAKGRVPNTPMPKTWKTCLAPTRRTPTSSPISLAAKPAVDEVPDQSAPRADVEYEVDLMLEEAFRGTERALEIDGHRVQASIPPGVRTGTRVRLAGRGEPGQNGGAAGDLFLIIKVLPNDILSATVTTCTSMLRLIFSRQLQAAKFASPHWRNH